MGSVPLSFFFLAFKVNIVDLPESPALATADQLTAVGVGEIMVCEPNTDRECSEFTWYDIGQLLKEKVIIDTRGICR